MTKLDAGHQIVIDTNVLVAGLRSRRGSSYQLLQLLGDKRFRPNVSVPLALEYEDVLKREFMQSVLSMDEVDSLLDYIFSISNLVEVRFRLRPTLRDSDDERILELAAQCEAMIVTFNIDDFRGAEAFGIRVLRPAEFLLLLGEMQWS